MAFKSRIRDNPKKHTEVTVVDEVEIMDDSQVDDSNPHWQKYENLVEADENVQRNDE